MKITAAEVAQNACLPVELEFGSSPGEIQSLQSDFPDVVSGIANNQMMTNSREADDTLNGRAAAKSILELGCNACYLADVCTVKSTLEQEVATGEQNQTIIGAATMIATAPSWLTAARIHDYGLSEEELLSLVDSKETTKEAMLSGKLDPERFLDDTTNEVTSFFVAGDLPCLKDTTVPDDAELPAHIINANGNEFTVIDASEAWGYKKSAAPKEFQVLSSKMLSRMKELGPNGKPQITQHDSIMQKLVSGPLDDLYELRMHGKSRSYLINPKYDQSQIIFVGSHGDSESDQLKMLNAFRALRSRHIS